MKIYIIRHGETTANKEGRFQGWTDNPLNEKGIELAEATGHGMRGVRFDRCYSSPLMRARQTAELVLLNSGNGDVPVRLDERLKEIHMGIWEGRKIHSEEDDPARAMAKALFQNPFSEEGFSGGESARDVCRRTQEFLKELAREESDDVCLIAIHGFAMRAMLNFLYDDPSDFWHKHVPYNCEVNILETKNGEIHLLEENKIYYDPSECIDRFSQFSKKKALIAMSGGVDSSVAAYIMKQRGYDCIGATMKLFDQNEPGSFCSRNEPSSSRTCCSLEDVEDARSVAFRLGIPYHVFNFSDDFREYVIDPFVAAYEKGDTPNPCINCNRYLKFRHLLQRAMELHCDTIVTGHYARVEQKNGRYLLLKGVDEKKDQSYVLYNLTQEELAHTCFPLGDMSKDEIRQIAGEQGFVNAQKPDSQDICFVPDGDYVRFMEEYTGHAYPEGDFLDLQGNILGKHKGAVRYTIGQRKGLGIAFGEPMYVCAKDMAANTVTLAPDSDLYRRELIADDLNWIGIACLTEPMEVYAKIRYRHKEQPAVIYPESDGTVRVIFRDPQRAITPGQSVVFYDGDIVVGGGRIC